MLVNCSLFQWLGLITAMCISLGTWANLLIYPMRVSFDEQQRSAQLTLTNTATRPITYRLSWQEKIALPQGGYAPLIPQSGTPHAIASTMLRYSPRQVRLAPGERQTIKLSLRRPRNLAPGEYRSHLLFKALPPKIEQNEQSGASVQINLIVNFAVPVTVQQGDYDIQVTLDDAKIAYNPFTSQGQVRLTLQRQGLHSSSGDISAYWQPRGGQPRLIAKLADYNLWAELPQASPTLIWTHAPFTPSDGQLRIIYQGVREFKGNTYLDETVTVYKDDIETLD